MIVGLIVAVSSNVKWKGTVEDEEEQDKFLRRTQLLQSATLICVILMIVSLVRVSALLPGVSKEADKRRVRPRQRYMRKNM